MAKLNFPDPTTTTVYEEAGLKWTWNSTLKVWSSEAGQVPGDGTSVSVGENPPSPASEGDLWWNSSDDNGRLYVYYGSQWVEASPQGGGGGDEGGLTQGQADALYISKKNDDTAAGAITFKDKTTHESGVRVTGGTIDQAVATGEIAYGTIDGVQCLQLKGGGKGGYVRLYEGGLQTAGENVRGKYVVGGLAAGTKFGSGTTAAVGFEDTCDVSNVSGKVSYRSIHASPVNVTFAPGDTANLYGFRANIEKDTTSGNNLAWSFFSAGTAPSYFNGGIQFDLTHSKGGTQDQLQLDRYEEGTFTAKFTNEPGVNYTNQYGHYTIIGNLCTATYFLSWDAMDTSSSDNIRLELPHQAAFTNDNYRSGTGLGYIRGVNFDNQLIMTLSGNATSASIWDLNLTGPGVTVKRLSDCETSGEIQTTISYHIA